MAPLEHAVLLPLDEKSQVRALERPRPHLPVASGRPAAQTHDDTWHGTTTLFAAVDVQHGTVIGRCMQRHRHGEFIRFLNAVEAAVPARKVIRAILDNDATHKHPEEQITRLKLVKRQMFDRAKLDLLEARLIGAG